VSQTATAAGDTAPFAIGSSSGQLTVNTGARLDFEGGVTRHEVVVRADDGVSTPATQTFYVNVLDVNDAPKLLAPLKR